MVDTEIWDFSSAIPTKHLKFLYHKTVGDLFICRCNVSACEGLVLGTAQPCIALHEGDPVLLHYTSARKGYHLKVRYGHIHISNANSLAKLSWSSTQKLLVVAMGAKFIDDNVTSAFSGSIPYLPSRLAVRNDWLLELLLYMRKSLGEPSHCNSACLELVGISLIIKLYELFGKKCLSQSSAITGGLGLMREKNIKTYIEQHLTENIRLADLAQRVNLSTDYFRKAFKQSFGKSPWRYIRERRINIAKEMLITSDQSITEIALNLQFSSHAHFTDTFHQITGIAPSKFRNNSNRGLF
ncbi:helix-turn-helix domain-containing protein [Thalassospira xiamenensis]|uniref:HTH araC/xylS-type domain-containing protein n=1 Tax=Thalassospira xiamenensis TaxID=220697 RepID=A0A367X8M8_9PROT|nr:AraC family transcriptional regulator [Thalassospira xiamenensis]KZB56358.1 hypothetical protein AUP41_14760 [Thalassospira xiamenensis]MCK2167196.1 AraC family transcriptional regulator [Thalassospira xiamenensis]RCK49998.1 hypothetical protein TH44_12070 [Thalassospira xiamenensis]